MDSSPVIDYIKKKIYSHPLRRDHNGVSGSVFAVSVNYTCPRIPCASSGITMFGINTSGPTRLIREVHCADCQQEIDSVLPPIETFAQRHWIVSNAEIEEMPISECLLERSVDKVSYVDVVCTVCWAGHKREYTGLIRKWMLACIVVGTDPGGLIARIMVNL
jgi:hypothetical protein